MKKKKWLTGILFWIGLLLLWQLFYTAACVWFGWAKPYAIPSPSGVLRCMALLCSNGTLTAAVLSSLFRVLLGFAISVLTGILLGILIVHSYFLKQNLKPLILGIQALPSVCWVPFAVLWFGLSERAILFVVVMGSAFGIAISIENCVKNVPPIYIKAARTMGVHSFALYKSVIFPAALPSFAAGLKQGWSFAWRALMSGEVMSASIGLGYTLMAGRDLADINQVATVMFVIIFIGVAVDNGVFRLLERNIQKKWGMTDGTP